MKLWASKLALLLFLVGCTTAKVSNIVIPKGSETAVVAVAKKVKLTENQKQNWQHLDLVKDSVPGMSVDKAYEFLSGKKGKQVIVAVLDSGTDLKHPDLKENAWVNPKEIAGNNKDDDKNGYVDDINGWNFLGKIYKENAELYRVLIDTTLVDSKTLQRAKSEYNANLKKAPQENIQYGNILLATKYANDNLTKHLQKKKIVEKDLENVKTNTFELKQSVAIAKEIFGFGVSSLQEVIDQLTDLVQGNRDLISGKVLKVDYRSILNDDENNMNTKFYGDSNSGPSTVKESHGTHVSGIIGAFRNNEKGINGVANNVKIMAVRVVPDGDEYDKDVALGIRYAVDNGAKIINTSFGKSYSPKSKWVYEAIKYAADNDVLIVSGAGNESDDIDEKVSYPNDSPDNLTEMSDNFLAIGAIGPTYDKNLVAEFSNYGKRNVDLFAPGVQVYSTFPENEYSFQDGTSMASPAVAGVAALIRSYYPEFTASQVKRILMNSGSKIDIEVLKPGSKTQENPEGKLVPFSDLSVTGRIVNAYNAVKMADALSK